MNQDAATVLEQLFRSRYSCRGYRPDPVPRSVIEKILTMAQRTASWCNTQPWQVTIVSGPALERFRDLLLARVDGTQGDVTDLPFPEGYHGVYQQRRRTCGFQLYESVGVARGDRAASAKQGLENFRFFGAPHVALITTDAALGTYGAVDCGAYVGNFMLAARSVGVAAIAQAALASYADVIRAHFKLADDRKFVCGISFGYEDPDHPANGFRTERADIAEVVTWVK